MSLIWIRLDLNDFEKDFSLSFNVFFYFLIQRYIKRQTRAKFFLLIFYKRSMLHLFKCSQMFIWVFLEAICFKWVIFVCKCKGLLILKISRFWRSDSSYKWKILPNRSIYRISQKSIDYYLIHVNFLLSSLLWSTSSS